MQEKNDYYVYVFKRKDNNSVFYVGSGRLNRINQKQGRNKDCKYIMDGVGYTSEFLHEGLSKKESRKIEEEYIRNPLEGWELTNKRFPTKANELDVSVLKEFFYYDVSSPSGLRYAKNTYKNRGALAKAKNDIAGRIYKNKEGKPLFWRVGLNINSVKYTFKVHRVIWCLLHNQINNNLVIDHIDNNPLNNIIDNLRLVDYHTNARNKKYTKISNALGIAGISLNKNKQYKAEIVNDNGRRTSKSFSISKYGENKALYLAAKVRYEYLTSLAGNRKYSNNHASIEKLIKIITNFESENVNAIRFGETSVSS